MLIFIVTLLNSEFEFESDKKEIIDELEKHILNNIIKLEDDKKIVYVKKDHLIAITIRPKSISKAKTKITFTFNNNKQIVLSSNKKLDRTSIDEAIVSIFNSPNDIVRIDLDKQVCFLNKKLLTSIDVEYLEHNKIINTNKLESEEIFDSLLLKPEEENKENNDDRKHSDDNNHSSNNSNINN